MTISIGELAARSGLKPSAIRYYESVGVLPEPRRERGQRRYDEDALRRLEVLEIAKRAGFSLDEARVLLESPDTPTLRRLAAAKLPEVDARIREAEAMRSWLAFAAICDCEAFDVCELFQRDAEQLR